MKQICLVCQNVDCKNRGAEELIKELQRVVAEKNLPDVEVRPYMCFGACQEGPNIVLYPEKSWYAGVKKEDLEEIVSHLCGGPDVKRLDTIDPSLKELIYQLLDTGVF
ncbi:MAG TPA: (2Fe-2S) ferredoxin domain-containing protein [Candidatus Acidoferrales bacterium]|nr:(2Fe-2S) ferredoxin domain-containing protein [Candidatus Acidoferrales bacterium]